MDSKTIQFIKDHENDDIPSLALQSKRYPDIDMPFVLQQIKGRQIAKQKIPSWYENENIVYPSHLALEQSSSEKTALYKASLCSGKNFVDLTGGMGADFSFMSKNFIEAVYVEKLLELTLIAEHNFKELNLNNLKIINETAESFLNKMEVVDTIFIDPARRDKKGGKTVLIEDCSPDLTEIEKILALKASQVIIKMSPMLDISQALKKLETINEVHIISVNNECKELLLVKNSNNKALEITYHCIHIKNTGVTDKYTFNKEHENSASVKYSEPLKYLYEPNPSILKAGGYKSIATDFNLNKLHVNSHLYTSEKLVENFPGRSFMIKNIIIFNKNSLKKNIGNINKANIACRNFPLTVEGIRKKTSIKEGGDNYIFATTLASEKKVFVNCIKI